MALSDLVEYRFVLNPSGRVFCQSCYGVRGAKAVALNAVSEKDGDTRCEIHSKGEMIGVVVVEE